MYLHELMEGTNCTLQLHDNVSKNTFDVTITKKHDTIGFIVDDMFAATITMLLTLDYACDLIITSHCEPIVFSNVDVKREAGAWIFASDTSGVLCDRRYWPRYEYSRPGVLESEHSTIPVVIKTYDVSKFGIGVITPERLNCNDHILVTFKSPELDTIIKANAIVVHLQRSGSVIRYGCIISDNTMFALVNELQSRNIRKLNDDE